MKVAITQSSDFGHAHRTHPERVLDYAKRYHRYGSGHSRLRLRARRRSVRALKEINENSFRTTKRIIDVASSLAALAVLSPLLLFIAVAIKLNDQGRVLFWQRRVGLNGEVFNFPKFRSMIVNADQIVHELSAHNHHGDSITFKIKRDPRVTPVGLWLRRYSLDELPQLWCVLRGQMSLVGPRPALPREVQHYSLKERRRLAVRPGLTCIWQVSGRADVPFDRQVQMDIQYVENQTLWLDLKLVASTFPAVISGRGAY